MNIKIKSCFRDVKFAFNVAIGNEFRPKIDRVNGRIERFGSDYGGWTLLTNDIHENSVIYSFGIGEDISFEIELMARFPVDVCAFDPTPSSVAWVKRQRVSSRLTLYEYGLAARDGDVAFFPPENPKHVSHTMLARPSSQRGPIVLPVKSLRSIMSELGHERIDVLKMDIEGAEYEVIESMAQEKIRPKQILVEFHHRFPAVGIYKTKTALSILSKLNYSLFFVSQTNQEFFFLRLD